MNTDGPGSYFDFKGLGELKARANSDENNDAVKEVAKQFEAYFIGEMLKSMRLANESFKSDLIDSRSMETYQEMFDKQVSLSLSERGALGLQSVLEKALERVTPQSAGTGLHGQRLPLVPDRHPLKVEKESPRFDLTGDVLRFKGAAR